jgi:1-acyl-sn-glycerol-3-phosphate acyltransferase
MVYNRIDLANLHPSSEDPLKASLPRRFWATFASYVIGFYASIINRFKIYGAENIPRHGGVLVASNHISGYETVFLPWAVMKRYPMQMVWAPAKEELFSNPLLGTLFRSWGAFPVKRGRDVRAGKLLNELLEAEKVMLFPEGTRNRDGVLGKGNRGVGKLIYDIRPAVVPTALSGLNRWKFPGIGQKGAVVFGPPLDFSDLFALEDRKETHLLIVERLMSASAALLRDGPQTKQK